MKFEDLRFIINPTMRLSSPYLKVKWVEIDVNLLNEEARFPSACRDVLFFSKKPIMTEKTDNELTIYFSEQTDFNYLKIQYWLRRQLKSFIEIVACNELPKRFWILAAERKLNPKGVTVRKLRSNTLGLCSYVYKTIKLSPKIVLFPQRMSDMVIIHELAHLKVHNHRKKFWDHLSDLSGEDSNLEKMRNDIAYSMYGQLIEFLLK